MNIKKHTSSLIFILICILSFIFLMGELGNLNALRQGTEGFYLQISNEMFESKNYLTPTYFGNNHWSKPPLHFWFAQLFYTVFNSNHLFYARLSILTSSFIGFILISNWVRLYFRISKIEILVFLIGSIGLIKYSRIYMMEMPLTILSLLASLYFFNYLTNNKIKDLAISSIFLGASILIKGPVSFIMVTGGIFIYLIILMVLKKENHFIKFFFFSFFGLLIGSLWFIRSYMEYGNEFFEYFFIRENLGKFKSKSYPIRHVFQGLFLYSLPWSLYLLVFIKKSIRKKSFSLFSEHNKNSKLFLYLLINFLFIFILWLIPSQRSHHYAIPSLPFFLILIYLVIFHNNNTDSLSYKVCNKLVGAFFLIISFLLSIPLFFAEYNQNIKVCIYLSIAIILFTISSFLFIKNKKIFSLILSSFLSLSFLWIYITPVFIYPSVPIKVAEFLRDKPVLASVRKPYFIEQALQKKIRVSSYHLIGEASGKNPGDYIILSAQTYKHFGVDGYCRIIERWPVWKHGKKLKEILSAIRSGTLDSLRTEILLVQRLKNNHD